MNGFGDFSQGKLQQAIRFNYVNVQGSPFTVQVSETYTYGGRDGRVSRRDTSALTTTPSSTTTSGSFTQGFSYNALGQVSSLDYPTCTNADCTLPQIFSDVPIGHPERAEIEAIFLGITVGCGGNSYCPNDSITRATMAVYLLLGKEGPGYVPPPCTTPMFADVPCSSGFAVWINELASRGITAGCGGGNYCPQTPVTNAQMAAFLLATLGVNPTPACPTFFDVDCASPFAKWVAEEARRGIMPGCGGGNFCPAANTTRAKMAGMITRAFDIPVPRDPHTARTVQLSYNQGLLTSVTANGLTYGTLSYYPNLLVNQIVHANGVAELQANDPNDMRRPGALSATGAFASWSSGSYSFDGAGNVKAIGSASFTYDKVSRLVSSTLFDGPTGGGNLKQQSYAFDSFGNITSITTNGLVRNTPTSAATNRLNGVVSYDAAGNLKSWNNAATYEYDAFNQMVQMITGSEHWIYLYTADDERLWSFDFLRNASRWAVRDLGGEVLRELQNNQNRWSFGTDYVYRDGLLLAAETPVGRRHYHLDHLGTARLITRESGYPAAYHLYYPFGEEATAFNQDTERMKFTGHERDLASPAIAGDDLDYMHARFFSSMTGRFLNVDPAVGTSLAPQAWNRYSYVMGNPLSYTDPSGQFILPPLSFLFSMVQAFTFYDSIDVKLCEGMICPVIKEVDRRAYKTAKLIEKGVMFELSTLLSLGFGELPAIAEFGFAKIPPPPGPAHNAANYAKLTEELVKADASTAQVAELEGGGGEAFAGTGARKAIYDIERLVRQYGGKASDWQKIRSTYSAGFETHAYRNVLTGQVIELKTKLFFF